MELGSMGSTNPARALEEHPGCLSITAMAIYVPRRESDSLGRMNTRMLVTGQSTSVSCGSANRFAARQSSKNGDPETQVDGPSRRRESGGPNEPSQDAATERRSPSFARDGSRH
jgi:hypothetical protein